METKPSGEFGGRTGLNITDNYTDPLCQTRLRYETF